MLVLVYLKLTCVSHDRTTNQRVNILNLGYCQLSFLLHGLLLKKLVVWKGTYYYDHSLLSSYFCSTSPHRCLSRSSICWLRWQPRVDMVEILRQYTLEKRRLRSLTFMIAFKILSDIRFFTISPVMILRSRKSFSLIVSMWWYFVLFSYCELWFSLDFRPWKQNFVNFCNVWEIENRGRFEKLLFTLFCRISIFSVIAFSLFSWSNQISTILPLSLSNNFHQSLKEKKR